MIPYASSAWLMVHLTRRKNTNEPGKSSIDALGLRNKVGGNQTMLSWWTPIMSWEEINDKFKEEPEAADGNWVSFFFSCEQQLWVHGRVPAFTVARTLKHSVQGGRKEAQWWDHCSIGYTSRRVAKRKQDCLKHPSHARRKAWLCCFGNLLDSCHSYS